MAASEVALVVTPDRAVAAAFERDLGTRYPALGLTVAEDAATALARCRDLSEAGRDVALILAGEELPDGTGVDLLRSVQALHPDAGRVLLADQADAEAAVLAVNALGLDRCLAVPWADASSDLYPVVDDLLGDWAARASVMPVLVSDVMQTDVATLSEKANLAEAARLVADTRVGDQMVVAADGTFVGVLSEGDILRSSLPDLDDIVAAGGTLRDAYQLFLRRARDLSDKPIAGLVITEPLLLRPTDHLAKAATVLIERQIRLLPVVEDGRLVGTLSRADICRAAVDAA